MTVAELVDKLQGQRLHYEVMVRENKLLVESSRRPVIHHAKDGEDDEVVISSWLDVGVPSR